MPTEAKLRPSVRPGGLVVRGSLVDHLSEGQSSGIVVVTAPPGYGKTVLASQWVQEDPRPFAWVTLDEGDNDPRVLLAYLVLALHRVQPVEPALHNALADHRPEALNDSLLPQLARTAAARRPFVLVLDGMEALTDSRSLQVVQVLATSLAEHSELVLVGRVAPQDWPSLPGGGPVRRVGVDDLRLDRGEAVALISDAGLKLSTSEVDTLFARTEGWAAGIYLAALSIATDVEKRNIGDLVAGSDSLIAAYLREELLDGLTPEDQAFLRRTSVLHGLNGALCDAVLATTGSAAVLHRLADANVLLAHLAGGEREWYHVHPLLTEALQAALSRDEPRLVPTLHRRARQWSEEHGDPVHAIDHAIAGREHAAAARLVYDQVGGCLAAGQVAKVEAWLDRFSKRQKATYAKLALTEAWCSLQRGRAADHWISLADHGRYEADRKGESASIAAAAALMRALVARNGIAQMGADARLAMDLHEMDAHGRCTAQFLIALSLYLSGRSDEARSTMEQVRELSQETASHQVAALALAELALMAADQGQWDPAQQLSDEATALLQRHDLREIPLLAPVQCSAALVAGQLLGPEAAVPVVQQAYGLFAMAVEPPLWQGVQCREVLARAELSVGDSAGARTLLSEAQNLLHESGEDQLRDRLEQAWRRVAGRPLEASPGTTLTRAEMRVLQLLPTHLSFAQIGQQLFVSRNTVKTQAVSAYRKLGVGSRSDAVDRARALGLLQPGPSD